MPISRALRRISNSARRYIRGGNILRPEQLYAVATAPRGVKRRLNDSENPNTRNVRARTMPPIPIGVSGAPGQSGTAITYRRRRRGRRGRGRRGNRMGKLFRKQYLKNIIKDLGTNSIVMNNVHSGTIDTNDQVILGANLYGMQGTLTPGEYGQRDMADIMLNWTRSDANNEKIIFSNGFLDLTFQNTSTNPCKFEVDVYTLKYKKSAKKIPNLNTLFATAATDQPLAPAGGVSSFTDFTLASRGATPFQFPLALAKGVAIVKKVKHFVPIGGYFTEQIKDTRKRFASLNDQQVDDMMYKGCTTSLLIVVKRIVGDTVGGSYSIGVTRTYTMKALLDNADVNMYKSL